MNERAHRFKAFLGSEIGREVIAMLDEQAKEPLDELYEIMVRKTSTVTGAGAHMRAGMAKGLRAFKESLYDVAANAK